MGLIVFYEGNNASQSLVQTVDDNPGQDFQPVKNEIRSLKLFNVRSGCRIRVYDSTDGSISDEFCIINVKTTMVEYIVNIFEQSYEDGVVVVTFIPSKARDGKVLRIKID